MAKPDKYEEQHRSLMNALADSVLDMSDEEVLDDFGTAALPRTKEILRAAAKHHAQAKLRAAKVQHEDARRAISVHTFDLPATAAEKRALLDAVLASHMTAGMGAFTAQVRDLAAVPDSDVERTLRQLEVLGVLRRFREEQP